MFNLRILLLTGFTAGIARCGVLLGVCGLLSTVAGLNPRATLAAAPLAAPPASVQTAVDEIAGKRAKISERIAKLSEPASTAPSKGQPSPTEPTSEDELDLLESLDLVYIQQQASSDEHAALEQEKKKLAEEAESLHNLGPAEPKPYSFLLLEDIRDQLGAENDRAESIHTNLTSAQDMLQTARELRGMRAPAAGGPRGRTGQQGRRSTGGPGARAAVGGTEEHHRH